MVFDDEGGTDKIAAYSAINYNLSAYPIDLSCNYKVFLKVCSGRYGSIYCSDRLV